jgi:hypothetical protein
MSTASQTRQVRRYGVESDFGMGDPRVSREAAWQAVERGFISPDPSFGAGLDEFDFPATVNRKSAEGFSIP